jgi:hypothetical protein
LVDKQKKQGYTSTIANLTKRLQLKQKDILIVKVKKDLGGLGNAKSS